MDLFDSAIDRAFAQDAHHGSAYNQASAAGGNAAGGVESVSNAAAPLPRKRPTAKPAAPSTTAAAPQGNASSAARVDPNSNTAPGVGSSSRASRNVDSPTAAAATNTTSSGGNAGFDGRLQQQHDAVMASVAAATAAAAAHNGGDEEGSTSGGGSPAQQLHQMQQIQLLQRQMEGMKAGGSQQQQIDPAAQAAMMQRMSGLMNELQSMMVQMAQMNQAGGAATVSSPTAPNAAAAGAGSRPGSAAPQQQQQRGFSGTPTADADRPSSHHDDGVLGLRTSAKPFEPPMPTDAVYGGRGGGAGRNGGANSFRGSGHLNTADAHHHHHHTANSNSNGHMHGPYGGSGSRYGGGGGGDSAAVFHPASGGGGVHWGSMAVSGGLGAAPSHHHHQHDPHVGHRNGGAPAVRPHGCVVCLVEFKRGRMKRYESEAFIAPGNYIVVEGDRGEDCGLVVHTYQRLPDGSNGRSETLEGVNIDTNKVKPETGRVRRVASDQEVERLHGEIATLERHALKTCRERVEQMGLDMEVVDCEYQFDRKKITFFFDSPRAVDFRELTKDLFKTFGARIWLENINSKVKNVVPDGALSHADKLLYAERGLRPPRR